MCLSPKNNQLRNQHSLSFRQGWTNLVNRGKNEGSPLLSYQLAWGAILRTWLCLMSLALIAVLAGLPAAAATIQSELPLSVCIAPVGSGETPADVFAGRVKLDCRRDQSDFGSGDFWALSSTIGSTGEQAIGGIANKYALRSGSVWQAARTIYVRYQDGLIHSARQDARQASANLQLGPDFFDVIPDRNVPIDRILWKIEGSPNARGIIQAPVLMSLAASQKRNITLAVLYAGFTGMIFALVIHHFALWQVMRKNYQAAYVVLLLTSMCYCVCSSGALTWFFPGMDNNDRARLTYLCLGLFAALSLQFARTFFEQDGLTEKLQSVTNAAIVLSFISTLMLVLVTPYQMNLMVKIYSAGNLGLLLAAFLILKSARDHKSRYLYIFILSWSLIILSSILRIADGMFVLSWRFFIENSTLIAMSFEALLSSVVIADRIRLINIERDTAKLQERAARTLADSDPLTNLLNRRAFLHQAIGRQTPQRLLVIDIDHFRSINESIGHDGGDEVLIAIAKALEAVAPADALVTRLGGDEFAVLCPVENDLTASQITEKIRKICGPEDVMISVSIGSCTGSTQTDAGWRELYRLADLALFEAKSAGRAQSRHFTAYPAKAVRHQIIP